MANTYIGIDSVARKVKQCYIGIDGVARKIKKVYIGVNGIAKLAWQSVITKLSTWISFENRSKFQTDSGSYHMSGVQDPLVIDDNTCILTCGMRNSDGDFVGDALAKVTTDDNSNVISVFIEDINDDIMSKCKLGNYYAAGTRSDSGSTYIHIINFDDTYFSKFTSTNGTIDNIYALNDTTMCGVCNNKNYGTQLFIATFDGKNAPTVNYVTVVSNATNARLIHVSGNQYILFYYLNSAYYLAPLVFNSLSSYTLGTAINISNTWLSISTSMSYVIDDNHMVLSTTNGYMLGVYIKDNAISLSSEMQTNLWRICRIGTSNSFFGFDGSYATNGIGKIIYYDVSNNSLSVSKSSISATTFVNNSGYNNVFVQSSVFVPKLSNKISMFFNSNNDYLYSFDFSFDV